MFRYLLVTGDGDALGVREFAVPSFSRGDTIPLGPGEMLRVLDVLGPGELHDRAGRDPHPAAVDAPVLVVERIALG